MKYLLNYQQLSFLYAFSRQMDLSLDRVRWTSLEELKYYYLNRISPKQIIKYLDNIIYEQNNNEAKSNKLVNLLFKSGLNEKEIYYYKSLLIKFDSLLLNSMETQYTITIEKLRVDIAIFYNEILGSKITGKTLKKLMKVEHFGQNPLIETIELNKFLPKDFYKISSIK